MNHAPKNVQQEPGWEIVVPKTFTNPLVWVVIIAVVGFGGYKFLNRPAGDTGVSQSGGISQDASSQQPVAPSQVNTLGFFKKVSETSVAVEEKPYFLYVGAQFCPFCAAERWSLVKALSNFGTWSGLGPDMSADEEAGFSRIPTYSFVNASYESRYIAFAHKETADRNGRPIPGQELTDFEKQWFNRYDPRGGVPFLFFNGQYVQLSSGFSPSLLSGKTYEQVKADMERNAGTPYVAAINKEADIITAYLCKATGNQPAEVCTKPEIVQLVVQVP